MLGHGNNEFDCSLVCLTLKPATRNANLTTQTAVIDTHSSPVCKLVSVFQSLCVYYEKPSTKFY